MHVKQQKHQAQAGFTLIEVLVSVVLTGMILTSAYAGFQGIMKSQIRLSGSINIQRNLFYLNEKLSSLVKSGGTIDYEEYFNRRMLGYAKDLGADGIWRYTADSHYGNGNNAGWRPSLYLCGVDSAADEDACLGDNATSLAPDTETFNQTLQTLPDKQLAYGQYRELWFDYNSLSGFPTPIKLPPIFPPPPDALNDTGISDLYLIKKLPSGVYERTYFRHVFIQDPFTPVAQQACNPATAEGCLGKIQMTRLVSCDSLPLGGDGIIDAWIPHPDFWGAAGCAAIIDNVNKIAGATTAATNTLVWADVNSPDMNIIQAQFLPSPKKIPDRMSGAGETAFSPVVQIYLEVQLSERVLRRWMLPASENIPRWLTMTFDLDNL